MDDIQNTLEQRLRELHDALASTDDAVKKLELLAEIHSVDDRLARLD